MFLFAAGAVTQGARTKEAERSVRNEPSVVDVEMNLGRDSSMMDLEVNTEKQSSHLGLTVNSGKESAVRVTDVEMSMRKEKTVLVTEMNIQKELPVSDFDMDVSGKNSVKVIELSVKNERSVVDTTINIKKEPSACMGTGMDIRQEALMHTDADRNVEKEPFVLETDVNVMKQTTLLETSIKKEPSLMDVEEDNGQSELPLMESEHIKMEPGLCRFHESCSENQPMPDFHTQLHIKSEPVRGCPIARQKLIVKFKSKATKRSQQIQRKDQSVQGKSKDKSKAVINKSDTDVLVKCEPTTDNFKYTTALDFDHQPVVEGGPNQKNPHVSGEKTVSRKAGTPHVCSHCQDHFCSRSSLKRHYKRKHSTENLHFSCQECDAVFARLVQLQAHERRHRGDKTFPCQECDVIFTRACHLTIHMRKHTGERPFSCKECDATFRSTSNLNRHKMKHSGLRPYVCTVCDADFYQSSHLVSHVRKHTGERPFVCVECNATFTQPTHLHRHMAKHTGRKPYLCCECGVGFVENCALKKHTQMHRRRAESSGAGGKKGKKGKTRKTKKSAASKVADSVQS